MKIKRGKGTTAHGPGVRVKLSGAEVATAIATYLTAHGIHVNGPRTITVNGALCARGEVYVDPAGFVVNNKHRYNGNGTKD